MVENLANSLVPVFGGLLLGYAAGLHDVVDKKDLRTLITFVTSVAAPCALFTTIVRASHPLLWDQGKVVLVLAAVYLAIYALTRNVVLITAIPCGFFGVVFGKRFHATPAVAGSRLIASTVAGIFTLPGWIVPLGHLQ